MPLRGGGGQVDAVGARADALDQLELRIGVHQRRVDAAAAKDQDRCIAALADVEFGGHRDQRHAVGRVQPVAEREHARRAPCPRAEELARPLRRDLAGAGKRVAGQADDVIVVENGNLRGHAGISHRRRDANDSTARL